MSGLELLCGVALIIPIVDHLAFLAPIAALFITLEMLLFCGLHLASGSTEHSSMVYWLVAAAVAAFVAYGRLILHPF